MGFGMIMSHLKSLDNQVIIPFIPLQYYFSLVTTIKFIQFKLH